MAKYQPRDKFFRKAREMGLPSRAAFKLSELLGRYRLAPPGSRVLDLGCAPGGWLAILSRAVGPTGRVVGIDLVACKSPDPCVVTLVGDIRDPACRAAAMEKLGGPADLVTCDIAPKLTGIVARDEAGSRELLESALGVARATLRPGGAMIAKIFMGGDFREIVSRFESSFGRVDVTRTRATRPGSAELYVIARDFRPGHF